ncbi:BTAD domain-containing putative transcriptional regulator [Streptantibioticus ferralitis]|uniref:BTAD domain-containing putative transcriptional regulator n=1 Tax=Streptantibioticus ferralitis TaxID=236510 RepID=A0ABT5YTX8_9ACTN|nr:BTAD domain-containing putative transcriptional regulator [Streptantibioticus ferralitis]MDF2255071.1 BTAD domain-containing putative transcriptional regulator [Streptantibioticus ferralitis]
MSTQTPIPPPRPGQADPSGPLLRVLGPMSAQLDGHDLPLGPPRRRTLLALLLIRLGRVVPTELLVEELWRDAPPRRPVATLQSHISHLRRVLDPPSGRDEPSALRYQAPGYLLQLAPEQVDVCRFEQLVTEGRQFLDRRDPLAARDRLTEALALWRGSPYTEFGAHPPLADESTRLEQLRLTALESCAEARLALGAADEVVAELDREVRRHPTRERLVGHLMTALSRLGRQAEALAVYERTRSLLVEEFGVDTAVELQRVHTAILRQELGDGGPADEPVAEPAQITPATDAGPLRPADAERTGPGPVDAAAPGPFTGRDQELHRLVGAAASALTGQGHMAAVLGPAGVGKTRLLMELAPRLEAADQGLEADKHLEVLWSHCFPGEGVPPYWLWTQILRQLAATRPDDFRTAAAPFGTHLAPLMPERSAGPEGGQGSEVDWAQARFLTHDAVCEVLLTLSAGRPLVLLLEDLHWADTASLDLLRLLGTRRQGHPLSVVLTARDLEIESDATMRRMLTELLRGPRTETLRLSGLSRGAVAALVQAQAGPGVGAEVIEALHQRSKGNPYFVMQLLSLLGDVRRLHDPGAADVLLAQIPTGVREALRQRFSALPEPVLRVLRLCAVIGTEVDTDLLHRTATRDEPVTAALESAIRADLLGEDPHHPGRLHFAHALVQETLIGELSREERHQLHARVAEALGARGHGRMGGEESERVAHHTWHAKGALPAERALPRLLRAAEHAEHRLAYEQVETWLRRAVHLVGYLPSDAASAPGLEQRLHIQLGQVLAMVRGYGDAEAEAALDRGRALNALTHAPEDPSVLWALCAALLVTGRYDESRENSGLLRELADRTRHPVALLGAAYGGGIVLHIRGRLPEALTELERGVEMADRFARQGHLLARTFQHDPRVSCRSYDAFTHWLLGDRDTAAARRRELLHLTEYESRPSDRAFALYVDAVLAAWEGDVGTARSSSAEGARVAGEHGLLYWKAMLRLPEGWALAHSGHEDDGIAQLQASMAELRLSRTNLRLPLHLGLLGQAQHHAGRAKEAQDTLRRMLAVIEHRREHVYLHTALPASRLLHELLGHGSVETVPPR